MTKLICPDCGSTVVQDGPITPACTYCAEKAGWFKKDGWWLPPYMKDDAVDAGAPPH